MRYYKFIKLNCLSHRVQTLSLGLFFVLLSELCFANFTIKSITGASDSDITETTPVIYASVNNNDCTSWDGNSDGDPDQGCSRKPITASSEVKICFTHDYSSDDVSNINVFMIDDTTDETIIAPNAGSDTGINSGSTACAYFTLGNLCNNETDKVADADSGTSCTGVIDDEIYLVGDVDKDGNYDSGSDFTMQIDFKMSNWSTAAHAVTNSGNCSSSTTDISCVIEFYMFGGDGKAHIYNPSGTDFVVNDSYWPQASKSLAIEYVRFYYSPGGPAAASVDINSTTNFKDIEIDEDGNFKTTYVDGLTNGLTYSFRVALVDEAGSVGYMMDAATTQAIGTSPGFQATPEVVYGIFEESKCFIATAAYGSPLAPKLDSLRNFRDQILLKSKWGKSFTRWYYMNSPQYAVKLLDKPVLQKAVRIALWPVWLISEASLRIGFEVLLSILALVFYVSGRWIIQNKRKMA